MLLTEGSARVFWAIHLNFTNTLPRDRWISYPNLLRSLTYLCSSSLYTPFWICWEYQCLFFELFRKIILDGQSKYPSNFGIRFRIKNMYATNYLCKYFSSLGRLTGLPFKTGLIFYALTRWGKLTFKVEVSYSVIFPSPKSVTFIILVTTTTLQLHTKLLL